MGLGLMGGSLGLALKRLGRTRVAGYARRAETRRLALKLGAVDDVYATPQEALRGANVVVFCTPILTIPVLVAECRQAFEQGCVVTDVGSTKAELCSQMAPFALGNDFHYVGSHPMAGSEKSGLEHARATLYEGAMTAVTPLAGGRPEAADAVVALWESVGAKVVCMDPGEHDRLVARTSHLPHLIAALLVAVGGREITPELKNLVGPGFRDTTRIAGGEPEMWHDIVQSNRRFILEELRTYGDVLRTLTKTVESGDIGSVKRLLESSAQLRKTLLG